MSASKSNQIFIEAPMISQTKNSKHSDAFHVHNVECKLEEIDDKQTIKKSKIVTTINPIIEELVFEHDSIRAMRWDEKEKKWKSRGSGKLTIYYNKKKRLGKIIFFDIKYHKTRLLQYIDGEAQCRISEEEILWKGSDYSMNRWNPMIAEWKLQFIGKPQSATQFMQIFNTYIDALNGNIDGVIDDNKDYESQLTRFELSTLEKGDRLFILEGVAWTMVQFVRDESDGFVVENIENEEIFYKAYDNDDIPIMYLVPESNKNNYATKMVEKRMIVQGIEFQKQLKQLQTENDALKQKISEYQDNGCQYVRNPILLFNAKNKESIKIENAVESKQMVTKYDIKMTKWMSFTQKMDVQYIECKYTVENKEKNGCNISELLPAYIQCKNLWQQQQNEMESITECVSELTKKKKQLKRSIMSHNDSISNKSKQYELTLNEYTETKMKREKLENELSTKLVTLNNCCDEENKLNEIQCKLLDECNTLDIELIEYKSILKHCGELIKKYTEFDTVNENATNEMQQYFDKKWTECMQKWYEWSAESIICWIKYLQEKKQLMLSNNIDLNKILQKMIDDKINGVSILNIDKEDLKSIGFEILCDRIEVFDKIRILISKYPHPSIYKIVDDEMKIPKQFLCPLSHKIMKNPVQIFDGNTYEKSEIESYLYKHKKSPITKEECDDEDIWFATDRKLKGKIETFLSVNSQKHDQ